MKKIKLTTDAIKYFHSYINYISQVTTESPNYSALIKSNIYSALLKYHIDEIRKKVQTILLKSIHNNKTTANVKFTRAELLSLSYFFKVYPTDSYNKVIEYELLNGLYL